MEAKVSGGIREKSYHLPDSVGVGKLSVDFTKVREIDESTELFKSRLYKKILVHWEIICMSCLRYVKYVKHLVWESHNEGKNAKNSLGRDG